MTGTGDFCAWSGSDHASITEATSDKTATPRIGSSHSCGRTISRATRQGDDNGHKRQLCVAAVRSVQPPPSILQPNTIAKQSGLARRKLLKPLDDACVRRIVLRPPFKRLEQCVDLAMKVLKRRIVAQNGIDVVCAIELGIDLDHGIRARPPFSRGKARVHPLRRRLDGTKNAKRRHARAGVRRDVAEAPTLFFGSKRSDGYDQPLAR